MSGRTLAYSEEFSELADPDGPGTILAIFLGLLSPRRRRQSTRQARLREPRRRRPEGNVFQFIVNALSYRGPQRNLLSTLQLPQ